MADGTTLPRQRRDRKGSLLHVLEGAVHAPSDAPLYVRLYKHVRDAIVSGALPPGSRLPASRTLAEDLQVSRNTVESALEQLRAEGFVDRKVGAGTRVASNLLLDRRAPARFRGGAPPRPGAATVRGPEVLSERGRATLAINHLVTSTIGFTFAPCIPDAQVLPSTAWNQIVARRSRHWSGAEMMPPEPAGHRPLREAVATYLASSRGVRCDWRQVLVVSSVQQAISLVARLLLDVDDEVWMEEPGYPGARTALAVGGARVVPVPVDDEGLLVEAGEMLAPDARLAYITPSHQYPLGTTMTLARRMALLEWAKRRGAWILEDDYDSEFRYAGRPLASMQGLDLAGRVIYAGTFNKVLFPSIRLAYLVLPGGLVEAFAAVQEITGGMPSTFLQAAVAEFIDNGHFAAHLREAREVFRERRAVLLSAAQEGLVDHVAFGPSASGLHVTTQFRRPRDDRAVSALAGRHRLDLPPLSRYYIRSPAPPGLLIHYAGTPERSIREGVATLTVLLAKPSA